VREGEALSRTAADRGERLRTEEIGARYGASFLRGDPLRSRTGAGGSAGRPTGTR
jgi:hypothetical protein